MSDPCDFCECCQRCQPERPKSLLASGWFWAGGALSALCYGVIVWGLLR